MSRAVRFTASLAVAVISMSLALSSIQDLGKKSQAIMAKVIARDLSATYMTGLATGHDFVAGETDLLVVIERMVAGVNLEVPGGEGDTTFVGLPGLDLEDQMRALKHLDLIGGRLVFRE